MPQGVLEEASGPGVARFFWLTKVPALRLAAAGTTAVGDAHAGWAYGHCQSV